MDNPTFDEQDALQFQDSHVLIVGGSGFIGSHLARFFKRGKAFVTSVSLKGSPPGLVDKAFQVDLARSGDIQNVLQGLAFDYVINAGGYIDHTLMRDGGRRVLEAHFSGLLNLLEGLDRSRLRSFVQIGSSDEYGGNPSPQQEDQRENPISPYSMGKVAASHFLQMLHRTEQFPAVVVRLFLVYGPGQNPPRFVPQVMRGFLAGQEINLSPGEQLRDFTYVDDIVRGIVKAVTIPAARGHIINLASGEPLAIKEVVMLLSRLIGKGRPKFGGIPYRLGENMRLYASIEKARSILGWAPQISLEEGLRLMLLSLSEDRR